MTWRDGTDSTIPSQDSGTAGSVVKHDISLTARASDDQMTYKCITEFASLDPAPEADEAMNVPDFRYDSDFEAITVHCKCTSTRVHYSNSIVKGCAVE